MGKKVMLEKVFAQLSRKPAARRGLVLVLKEIDKTKKDLIIFGEKDWIERQIYSSHHGDARAGFKKSIDSLSGLRQGERLFSKIEVMPTSRCVHVNPYFDIQGAARGYRAFPECFLAYTAVTKTVEKTRDIPYAGWLYATEHVEAVAKTGYVEFGFRTLLRLMCWQTKFLDRAIAPLEVAIAKAANLGTSCGLIISVKYYKTGSIDDYFDNGVIKFEFTDDLLKDFLGAFGLEPAIKKVESSEIPFELLQETSEGAQQFGTPWWVADTPQYNELAFDELLNRLLEKSRQGCCSMDWLLDKVISRSLSDIDFHKKEIEACRKAVGELLMELEARHCHELGFISQYWNGFFECRKDNDVFYLDERIEQVTDYYPEVWWVLIKDFVLRLNEAKLLGDLADIDTIKLRLKPDWNDWAVEELEKTVAKVKSWEQQERKVASC